MPGTQEFNITLAYKGAITVIQQATEYVSPTRRPSAVSRASDQGVGRSRECSSTNCPTGVSIIAAPPEGVSQRGIVNPCAFVVDHGP